MQEYSRYSMILQFLEDILTNSQTHEQPDLTHEQEQAVNDLIDAMDRVESDDDILIDSYPQLTHSGDDAPNFRAITRESLDDGDE